MTETILLDFKYELPSGSIITVYARHTPGLPEIKPTLNHAGCPADEGEIEIEYCDFYGEEIDLAGLWFGYPQNPQSVDYDMHRKAWEALE